MWAWVRDSSLLLGPLPTTVSVVGALSMVGLLARPARRWWLWWVPSALMFSVASVGVADLTKPFPDALPIRVWSWLIVGMFAVGLAAARLLTPGRRRSLGIAFAALVILTAAIKINAVYQYRPTVAAALGLSMGNEVSLDALPRRPVVDLPHGRALVESWQPPPDMPVTGEVARVVIPAVTSGFVARPGWVYLPPAYLTAMRPPLPVLVLLAGQPGWPSDWLTAGHLAQIMDRFAAGHRGLAPVVVIADGTGSALANPLCLDSRLGRVHTYLSTDVPTWIETHLQVTRDHRQWAIGGFSYGGTCALQLAVNAPTVYPTFLDISGDTEPSLGTRARTVAAAFDGNESAFRAVNPLDVLARSQLPASAGRMVVGYRDTPAAAQATQLITAAGRAHLDVQLVTVSGAHTWSATRAGLAGQLSWLGLRLGLATPAVPPAVRVIR